MAWRLVRFFSPSESVRAWRFVSACKFSASSKRAHAKTPAKKPVSPPVLIDSFIKRAQFRQTEISDALARQGWACIDNFMGNEACAAMRIEANVLMQVCVLTPANAVSHLQFIYLAFSHQAGALKTSQSSKWDAAADCHVAYDKHNVLSTEMLGGDM
jgi:hypothetical protein